MAYYKPEELETMRNSLKEAKSNPDDPRSKEIFKRIQEGKMNFELKALGLPTVDVPRPKVDLQAAMRGVNQVPAEEVSSMVPEQSRAAKQVTGAASDLGEDIRQAGTNIKEGFQRRTQTLGEDINRRAEDGTSLRESIGTGLGFASVTLRTAFDTLGEAGMLAVKSVMTPEQEAAVAEKFQQGIAAGLEATEGTAARDKVEQMIAAYNVWAEENPEEAANVRDTAGIMLSLAEAAGLKVGSVAAREAADIAADTVTTAARATGEAATVAGRQIDEGLQTAARTAGEAVDTAMEGRRAARVESQQTKVDDAVARITQAGADTRAKEQAKRALLEIDTSDVKTYEDLNNEITDQISTLSRKVDAELDRYPEKKSLDELSKITQVGDEVVTENPVISALDGLEEAYTKTGEAANAARIRQLKAQAQSEGLSLREVNELAREYGIEFRSRAFTKTGDIKTGFSAENYENTRKSLKEVLRDQMPDDVTKEIDRKISDLYSTRDLTSKIEDRVAKLQQRIKNRTLAQKVGGGAAAVADMLTFGSLRGFVARLLPSNMGNKAMNALEIQEELSKNLKELDKLLNLKNNDAFAEAFEDWAKNIQPGMSIRSTVRPDLVAGRIDGEDFSNITKIIDNPDTRIQYEEMIKGMGLGNATDDELVGFLKEVVDEYEGVAGRPVNESFNQGATPQTTSLIEEARKYDSAEEFVNNQLYKKGLYHGTLSKFDDANIKAGKDGLFLTSAKLEAQNYTAGESRLKSFVLSPEADIKDLGDVSQSNVGELIKKAKTEGADGVKINKTSPTGGGLKPSEIKKKIEDLEESSEFKNEANAMQEWMMSGGTPPKTPLHELRREYDALLTPTHTILFNTDKLMTKKQLEDIWKNANQ